jgi:hypothetical protein
MQTVFNLLLRLLLLIAGLVFTASLAIVAVLLLALWSLRAVWCKLTGQPVNPFVVHMSPSAGFGNIFRPRSAPTTDADPAKSKRIATDDVTDVEPKDLGGPPR